MPVGENGIAASRGARRWMRIAAIVGPVCSVLEIIMGSLNISRGQGQGIVTLTVGCVLSVFWCFMIPGAGRSGKL
jgi:hypothetical protein